MSANPRRRGRVAALQALFESDVSRHDALAALEQRFADGQWSESQQGFARELVEGVLSERDRLDEVIAKAAPQWPVDQLSAIDRNILRLAIWEILVNNRAPIRAAINEAVELAKEYGSDNSAKFVNGVLGSVSLTLAR
jgi:N utilization substance protein B